jgi:acyl carrier protein
MDNTVLSDAELSRLLVAVGADRDIDSLQFDRSFEDLGLDSLAQAEFAAKLKEHCRADVQEHIAADVSPNKIRRFVLDELSARTGM